MRFVLVYQGGIANVFRMSAIDIPHRERVMQDSFRSCEVFVRGCQAAGAEIDVALCTAAGNATDRPWIYGIEALKGALWRTDMDPPLQRAKEGD